jgi:hypothetical protein
VLEAEAIRDCSGCLNPDWEGWGVVEIEDQIAPQGRLAEFESRGVCIEEIAPRRKESLAEFLREKRGETEERGDKDSSPAGVELNVVYFLTQAVPTVHAFPKRTGKVPPDPKQDEDSQDTPTHTRFISPLRLSINSIWKLTRKFEELDFLARLSPVQMAHGTASRTQLFSPFADDTLCCIESAIRPSKHSESLLGKSEY